MSTERLISSGNLDIQFQFVSLITIIYGGKPEGLPLGLLIEISNLGLEKLFYQKGI
jgi:hypothetical protein